MKSLLGLMLLIAAILGCNQTARRERKSSPDFQFTATDLSREYIRDRVAADAKYKGKTLAVKGVVDWKMSGTIAFNTEPGQAIQCYFSQKDRDSFAKMKNGAEVVLIGYCDGDNKGNLSIVDCATY